MSISEQQSSGKVLRAKDAAAFLGLGVSTFWRWVKEGRLPKGTRLSARVTVWRISDLESFIDQQAAHQGGI